MTSPRRRARRSASIPCAPLEAAICGLEVRRLVQARAAARHPVRHPLAQALLRNTRLSEHCAAATRVAEQRDRSLLVHEPRLAFEERAEPLRGFAHRDAFGTCD